MGAIQNSINQTLSTVAGAVALKQHFAEQETKRADEVERAGQGLEGAKEDQAFDAKEAAAAIKAHAKDEHLNRDELKSLKEEDPEKLAENVKNIREGKLMDNRMKRLDKASKEYAKAEKEVKKYKDVKALSELEEGETLTGSDYLAAVEKENAMTNLANKKTELEYAYDAERELNQRLQASRKIETDIRNFRSTIEARGNKKEKEMYLGGTR